MNLPLSSIPKTRIGTCPHGLPMGACPICNGGGGGGGAKKMERPAGEMSWDECFAVGQQMKALKLAQQKRDMAMQGQIQVPLNIAGRLENMAQKIAGIADKLTNIIQKAQTNPTILSKAVAVIANVAVAVLNVVNNVVQTVQKAINFVQQKLADISDKLTAVFGELKAAVEKKISDKFKDFKKKAKSLFGIFEPLYADDEEKRIEEAKRLFDLKTAFNSIKKHLTKNKEEIDGDEN